MSGFVYLLGNFAMPTFYKIGMSERNPHERARQLSAPSGVPHPFDVICHIRTDDALRDEQHLHEFLTDFRHAFNREFFRFASVQMPWLVGLFKHHPNAESFWLGASPFQSRYLPGGEIANPWAAFDEFGEPAMTEYAPDYVYCMEAR